MADMDRAATTRFVYERLARPGFRSRLTATAPDGTRPVIVTMREDPLGVLVDQVRTAGGAGNVVLPTLNGVVVLAVTTVEGDGAPDGGLPALRSDCTVGVLLARLGLDGLLPEEGVVHDFTVVGPDSRTERGRAELIALGG